MGRVARRQHRRGGGLSPPSAKPGHRSSVGLRAFLQQRRKSTLQPTKRPNVGSGQPPFGHRIVVVRPMRRPTGRFRLAT
jgi:hypothetical protein